MSGRTRQNYSGISSQVQASPVQSDYQAIVDEQQPKGRSRMFSGSQETAQGYHPRTGRLASACSGPGYGSDRS